MRIQDKDIEYDWNNIKKDLKKMFPVLTDSDLLWRNGTTRPDLLKDLAVRIGISYNELEEIVEGFYE